MHVRFCVACQEEYRPEIARCADCGGLLEDRHDDDNPGADEAFASPDPGAEPSFPDAQALARSPQARALVPLADRLLEAGIQFRIVPREAGEDRPLSYELEVPRGESEDALEAVADLEGPDSGVTLLVVRVAGGSEDTEAALRCPGCDTEVDGSAAECPECGLGLSG